MKSHCANMNLSDKIRYTRIFQQVTYKGGESAMNQIKIFQNAQALSVSVENTYSMQTIVRSSTCYHMQTLFRSQNRLHVDCCLIQVYKDHIRSYNGRHLDGCIANNNIWQVRWQLLVRKSGSWYRSPKEGFGQILVKWIVKEFRGVREKPWNT